MATVTAYTAARMKQIEDSAIVDGDVVVDNLILKRFDGGTIDAGNVRGPTGSPGVSNAELDAWMKDNLPICTVLDYLGIVAPSAKFLTMVGQTVPNGNTLYPDFWAKIPASMKHANGTSIIMPDTRGRVAVCYDPAQPEFDQIIEIGGEKAHILAKAELPASTVAIDAPATAVTGKSGDDSPNHIHKLQVNTTEGRDDNVLSTGIAPGVAGYEFVIERIYAGGPHALQITPGTGAHVTSSPYTAPITPDISHYHSIDGYTAGQMGPHQHAPGSLAVDIPVFQSGPLGSGNAHNILQSYVVFLKIIKVL